MRLQNDEFLKYKVLQIDGFVSFVTAFFQSVFMTHAAVTKTGL